MTTFPQPFTSTVSHWQATNRGKSSLFNHNRDKKLPTDVVDYVVIGAGMAGASMAYHLTRPGIADGKKVVVLEAKDVASGATGRNGGHCAPYSFGAWTHLTTPLEEGGAGLTPQETLEVLDLEKRVLEYVTETIEKEKWEVDFWRGEKLEVRRTEIAATQMELSYAAWIEARSASRLKDVKPEWEWIADAAEAQRISRIKGATGCSKGPAGSLHPHKLATAFLKSALATGQADLYSWSPVQKMTKNGEGIWDVDCGERGTLKTKEVIVCTNAHTGSLFKGTDIDEYLTPFQGQAANVTPPPSYSGAAYLNNTYTIEDGPYLVATPHAGIVLGLHHKLAVDTGILEAKDVFGNADDSFVHPNAKAWLANYCKDSFADWGKEAPGEGGMRFWAGIQCATKNTLPLVGQVPGERYKGIWIAAGFHGHGMARIALTTKYLAKLVTTGKWDAGLPLSFKITTQRLEDGKKAPPYITDADKVGGVLGKVLGGLGYGGGVKSVAR
ncbi:hypothetical protein CI109_103329 [Kwoniella shandongensis]|uniref:Uncharacterized protein n=1 Tax=Kwoniella shandongensis TaxID=1734106 RepID=A0A5M6C1L7_9TREE|nr:uncharacterized protein CI109_004410 [Kwoniella shandongensis]KAA5527119.1 hypothetical protein CI109_004410 [Kwoniella shandongensis]